jgi:tetratricopeptide (TPR) repeat protein
MNEQLAALLTLASQAQRAGQFHQAEALCTQILQADSDQPDAWNLLAMVHYRTNRPVSAIEHLQRAIQLRPDQAILYVNLAEMLRPVGRLQDAEASYRRALELDPQLYAAWSGLGIVLCRVKQPSAGLAAFDQAIKAQPGAADAYRNRGLALMELRRFDEAIAAFSESIRLQPANPAAYMSLGRAYRETDQTDKALECFVEALRQGAPPVEVHLEEGRLWMQAGSPDKAVEAYRHAAELNPHSAEAHNGLGIAYKKLERFAHAVASYQQALAVRPDFVEALGNMSNALCELKRFDEAEVYCRQALDLSPNSSWVHNSLGMVLYKQSRWSEAEAELRRALELDGAAQTVYQNLGTLLYERGRPHEAEPILRRALAGNPSDDGLLCSLGNALQDMGHLDEATANFDAALRVNPDCANARFNRSLVSLLRGDFASGWNEYEWRWKRTSAPKYGSFSQPAWQGEPLSGRTLLLHCEQGFGDTLQFIRLAELINKRGGRVVFVCPRTLIRVIRSCRAIDELVVENEPLPAFDVHLPLMSLPKVLGLVREQDLPATIPYLEVDPLRVEAWRARLAGVSGRKIGINWQGNPKHTRDALRSIPLAEFSPLARVAGVQLYSLQKGPGREQLADLNERNSIIDLADELFDFAETGAACQALDLVITCDSACAHLAGALGRPVWLVLPAAPDWRWQLEREDSPWYPTMRLFRQSTLGDWSEVFARITAALQSLG